ncbi:MAG: hypothetical protein LC802_11000 [Acidobacteria bacterium]|nr:hypothetical protein [Acidobacteriota bacterium]
MNNNAYLGIVQDGRFRPLASDHEVSGAFRVTKSAMQAAESPESGEVSLAEYEGSAVILRGVESGDWIYSASVIEKAGYILTMVVQEVFNTGGAGQTRRLKFPWV